jgi:ferritin
MHRHGLGTGRPHGVALLASIAMQAHGTAGAARWGVLPQESSMLSQVVVDAINAQINSELHAHYSYLAMSAYCERINFTGAARWLRAQSQEEHGHALRLFDFLLAKNAKVELKAVGEPRGEYASLLDVFETAYRQEQNVTTQINGLYEVAFKEKAFDTVVQTEWFVNEQVEEEKSMREIVAKLQMVKDDPPSLLDLDRELGARPAGGAVAPAAN